MLSTTNSPVTYLIVMIPMLTGIGGLLACLVPTYCLRSLENWPPFQRAFRQYVGNPEAICSRYDNVRQQPDGNYAFGFGPFYTDLLHWTGQPFLIAPSRDQPGMEAGCISLNLLNKRNIKYALTIPECRCSDP